MPVLPAVLSTTRPPGLISPRFSACKMISRAGRSFTDWPGFMNSALPKIVQPVSSDARRSLISGVLPIASSVPERICMTRASTDSTRAALAQIIRATAFAPRLGAVARLHPAAGRLEEVVRPLGEPFERIRVTLHHHQRPGEIGRV